MRRALALAALLMALGISAWGADYVTVSYTVARPDGTVPGSVPGATLSVTWQANPDPAYITGPQSPAYSALTGVLTWSVPKDCQIRVVVPNTPLSAGATYSVAAADVNLNTAIPAAPAPEPSWAELLLTAAAPDLSQVEAPTGTLTLTPTGSGVLTGSYYYAVTYVTADGETSYGALSGPVSPSAQQVAISGIPVSSDTSVTARKLYRTAAGAQSYTVQLLAVLSDNTTTTYTDNAADGSLGAYASYRNSTGGAISVNGTRIFEVEPLEFIAIGKSAALYGNAGIIAIGDYSGPQQPSTDHQSVYIGSYAGASSETASGDVSIGAGAGYSNASGHRNARVGLNSGYYNASGWYNTLFGAWAGFSSTAGYGCTFLGYQAGYADTGDSLLRITVAKSDGTAQTLISGQGGASPSVTVNGTFSATNISGTNTGDQDLTDYAQVDVENTWTERQVFWDGAAFGGTASSDVEPSDTTVTAQGAYPLATTHTTGGDLYIGGGVGTLGFTIVDYSSLYGQAVAVSVDSGLPTAALYILTEGVEWSAQTSDMVTAQNLAAAINAWCPGAYATASGASVGVEKAPSAATVSLQSYTSYVTASNATSGECYIVSPLHVNEAVTLHGAVTLTASPFSKLPSDERIYISAPITRVSSSAAWSPTGFNAELDEDDGTLVLLQFEDANVTLDSSTFTGLSRDFVSSAGAWLLLAYDSTDARFEEVSRFPELPPPATSGNVLTSDGTTWTSAAPAGGTVTHGETFALDGILAVRTGVSRWYPPAACTLASCTAFVGTAPTGSAVTVDVNKNGTTVLSSPLSISDGSYSSAVTTPTTTSMTATDYLTVDVDSIGSTEPGRDLTVRIVYTIP